MCDYSYLYYQLFNAITDAIEFMNDGQSSEARQILINAQRMAEEYYLRSETEVGENAAQ